MSCGAGSAFLTSEIVDGWWGQTFSYGEAEENFIRKLFGENIRRSDNFANVTVNGRISLV
jgi:hypothetical protein